MAKIISISIPEHLVKALEDTKVKPSWLFQHALQEIIEARSELMTKIRTLEEEITNEVEKNKLLFEFMQRKGIKFDEWREFLISGAKNV